MDGGRDTRSGGSVARSNDFLTVQEVDTEETDRVEEDEQESEDDGDVSRDEVVRGDLRSADGEAELHVSRATYNEMGYSPCKWSCLKRRS